jgi:hypothetical protein
MHLVNTYIEHAWMTWSRLVAQLDLRLGMLVLPPVDDEPQLCRLPLAEGVRSHSLDAAAFVVGDATLSTRPTAHRALSGSASLASMMFRNSASQESSSSTEGRIVETASGAAATTTFEA